MYLWFNVILEVIDEISCWAITSHNKDLSVIAFSLGNSQFLCLLPHYLCKVTSATSKTGSFKVISMRGEKT